MKEQSRSLHLLKEWASQSLLSLQMFFAYLIIRAFISTQTVADDDHKSSNNIDLKNATFSAEYYFKWFVVFLSLSCIVFIVIILSVDNPRTKMAILHWFPVLSPAFFVLCSAYFNLVVSFHPKRLLSNPGVFLLFGVGAIGLNLYYEQAGINAHYFIIGFTTLLIGNTLTAAQANLLLVVATQLAVPFALESIQYYLFDCNYIMDYIVIAVIAAANLGYFILNQLVFCYLEKDNNTMDAPDLNLQQKRTKLKWVHQCCFQVLFIVVMSALVAGNEYSKVVAPLCYVKPQTTTVPPTPIPIPDSLPLIPCFDYFQNCTDIASAGDNTTDAAEPPPSQPPPLEPSEPSDSPSQTARAKNTLRKTIIFENHARSPR